MKRRGLCISRVLGVLLGGLLAAGIVSCRLGEGSGFNQIMALKLDQSLCRSVEELEIPGAVMGVRAPNGSTWYGACGSAALPQQIADASGNGAAEGEPMAIDRFFRIASVTKTFTATIILQLVDEGKLSLDDTIDGIIARWFAPGHLGFTIPYGETMTLRNILEMRSGMVDSLATQEGATIFAGHPLEQVDPVEMLRWSAESVDPAPYAPDTQFEYCNTNFILQGIIIEQVTGNSYASEVNSRLLQPLGMHDTSLPDSPAMPEPFARGYLMADGQVADLSLSMNPGWAWAAGGLISTIGDILIWAKALEEGELISPEAQQERLQMKDGQIETWPVSYGLGIYDDSGAVGHYGTFMGYYTSYCMRYRGYDIVVLENGELAQAGGSGRNPARSIFWNAVRDISL
ncbi:MAG: beta-lactamase family protein [Proteobacteria bacterium]|nr:beta-lactamase family protein [Pseudomonadota bacterium]